MIYLLKKLACIKYLLCPRSCAWSSVLETRIRDNYDIAFTSRRILSQKGDRSEAVQDSGKRTMTEAGTHTVAVHAREGVTSLLGSTLQGQGLGPRARGQHCLGHSLQFFLSSLFVSCQEEDF